jgi:hypothetical protein
MLTLGLDLTGRAKIVNCFNNAPGATLVRASARDLQPHPCKSHRNYGSVQVRKLYMLITQLFKHIQLPKLWATVFRVHGKDLVSSREL